MKKLGLTGSIATGKSTVLNIFKKLGYSTFSADEEVHYLYQNNVPPKIKSFYLPAYENNRINRHILAKYLMENPTKLAKLEKLIHPLIHQYYENFLEKSKEQGQKLIVADIPLLFESSYDYGFDFTIVTYCSPKIQMQRALNRKGMTKQKLEVILANQMDQNSKKQRADYLINTNGSLRETREQIKNIITKILQTPTK